jgi:hypothetical protein
MQDEAVSIIANQALIDDRNPFNMKAGLTFEITSDGA